MTTLTLYHTSVASVSTLTTAFTFATALGGAQTNGSDGTRPAAANVVELRGTAGNDTGASTLPAAASTHGWILDSTLLEGQTIPAGNWVVSMEFADTTASWTCRVAVQVWKRTSAGVYSLMASNITGTSAATTTSYAAKTCTAAQAAAMTFAVGDKLYIETYASATVRPASGATLLWHLASGSTGLSTGQITTPGFFTQGTAAVVSNSAVVEGAITLNASAGALPVLVNAAITEAVTIQGNGQISASNSLLSVAGQVIVPGSATVAGNAALSQTRAQMMTLGTLGASSALTEVAAVVLGSAPVLASSTLASSDAQLAATTTEFSSSALAQTAALVVNPSVALSSSALLVATGGLANTGVTIAGAASMVAGSLLAEAAQISAEATMSSSSSTVAMGGLAPRSGDVTPATSTVHTVAIGVSMTHVVLVADVAVAAENGTIAAVSTVTIGDSAPDVVLVADLAA